MSITDELLRVHVVKDDTASKPKAPCDISVITKTFIPSGVPEMILPHAPSRLRYFIRTLAPVSSQAQTVSFGGTPVPTPGAGAIIASQVFTTGGLYSITVNANVQTAVAVDHNNMGLYVNGVLQTILPVATAGEADTQSAPVILNIPAGATVTVQAIAASTAADYYAIVTATPLTTSSNSGNVILAGSFADAQAAAVAALNAQNQAGAQFPPGVEIRGEGTTELWVVSPFANPAPVSVMSEYKK